MPREVPQGPTGLYELQQPEKLRNALEQDKVNDCMTCRITGKKLDHTAVMQVN